MEEVLAVSLGFGTLAGAGHAVFSVDGTVFAELGVEDIVEVPVTDSWKCTFLQKG
jgi:hypothetical protein